MAAASRTVLGSRHQASVVVAACLSELTSGRRLHSNCSTNFAESSAGAEACADLVEDVLVGAPSIASNRPGGFRAAIARFVGISAGERTALRMITSHVQRHFITALRPRVPLLLLREIASGDGDHPGEPEPPPDRMIQRAG